VGKLILAGLFLWAGYGLLGVIIAYLLIQGIVFIVAIYKIISEIGFIIPKFIYMREYLRFSLHLTPNSLIRWITDSSDRYLVSYFLGLSSVGIYSAAYSIGWLINLLIAPIQFILYPELSKMYDEGKEEQVKTYLSYSLRYFLMLAIPTVFGLAALGKPLLEIITTENFVSGWTVIPLVAFAGLLAGVFQIIINITHLVKQTKMNLYIYVLAAVVNIIFNILFIPSIGITGAAISTVLSFIVMIVACYCISSKYLWFDINYFSILKFFVASLIMYVCITVVFYPNNIVELIILVFFGIAIYFMFMFLLKGFSCNEIVTSKKLVIQLVKKIRSK
jgi:O-antigen/teichoic acid export membrane protein